MRYIHCSFKSSFSTKTANNGWFYHFSNKMHWLTCVGAELNNLSVPKLHKAAFLIHLWYSKSFKVHSENSKSLILSDFIVKKLDRICLTEILPSHLDGLLFNELTPAGFGLFDSPRLSGRERCIIVVFNKLLEIFSGHPQVSLLWMFGFESFLSHILCYCYCWPTVDVVSQIQIQKKTLVLGYLTSR